jgi:long-chain acyl-CoA synthetase
MRETILSFLDDYKRLGEERAFSYRHGLRMRHYTYSQIAQMAFQFSHELEARSISKGDRVLLWGENSPQWIAAFFGCVLRGVIVVPLDAESSSDFILRVQRNVEAKLLIYSFKNQLPVELSIPSVKFEDLIEQVQNLTFPHSPININEDDVVQIIYTSGTTTDPKGVILTHRNLIANINPLEKEVQKYIKWERLVHPVRFLNLVPLSHIFGQFMGLFIPSLIGGEVYFQKSLNPAEIIETTKENKISVIVAVPRILKSLRDKLEMDWKNECPSNKDYEELLKDANKWHPLRRWWAFRDIHKQFGWKFWAFVSGGATLPTEIEDFWHRLGFAVIQGYGMTETASLISVNHPFKKSHGSIGKTLPGREIRLDENGEILVRGENVSPGYWKQNNRALVTKDGWLRTGDVGELDNSGHLFFKGRKKETIVTSAGMNVYPEDLEKVLNQQPEVRDSVVVGIEMETGPEPVAVLILYNKDTNVEAIIKRANDHLALYQQIRRWLIWTDNDFPRTTTQKIRKQEITDWVKSSLAGDKTAKQKTSNSLAEMIANLSSDLSVNQIEPTSTLMADLRLDSLARVELLSALEDKFQIDINEATFTATTTISDIQKIIQQGTKEIVDQYPYPRWSQKFPVTWLRLIGLYFLVLPITRLLCWTNSKGLDELRNLKGPVLFISNHITMVDHALILATIPGRFSRRLAVAMEGEVLRGWRYPPPETGWIRRTQLLGQYILTVTLFNVFPLPKKSGFRRAFSYAGGSVDRGYNLLVFPEGKRTESGEINSFMPGIGLLASKLNITIVPLRINGLFSLKEKKRWFALPGQVTIKIGQPIKFNQDADPAYITNELERTIKAIE